MTYGKYISILIYAYDGEVFARLESKKDRIENVFGDNLDWYSSREKSVAKRIILRREADIYNPIASKEIYAWMIERFDKLQEALDRFNYQTEDDLYAAVGYGEVSPLTMANRLTEKERKEQKIEQQKQEAEEIMNQPKKEPDKMKVRHEGGVVIQGVENLLIRISRCCNPIPGDDIVGYITKGRGISIHRRDCPNVQPDKPNVAERLIEVEWEDTSNTRKEYDADLEIYGYNRSGLLNDVLQTVNALTKNLNSVEARTNKDKMATIHLTVGIQNLSHLKSIVDKIKAVPDVYSVRRTNG